MDLTFLNNKETSFLFTVPFALQMIFSVKLSRHKWTFPYENNVLDHDEKLKIN